MRAEKKKRAALPVLRNVLIVLAALAVCVASTELILGAGASDRPDETSEEYQEQADENGRIFLFHTEQLPAADLLAGITPTWELHQDIYNTLSPEEKDAAENEQGRRYPHLAYLHEGCAYDGDTVNIVVLGDSFTWGQAVTNRNEVYWRLLETNLRAQGYNVRVYGVGMCGANCYEELSWLTDTALMEELDPDLVVFGYLYNDPDRRAVDAPEDRDKPLYVDVDERYAPLFSLAERIVPNIASRLKNYLVAKTMYTHDGLYIGADTPGAPVIDAPILKGACLKTFEREFLAKLDDFSARRGVPVVVMPLAIDVGETMLKELYRPLHEVCPNYSHLCLYDTADAFFDGFASKKHAANYNINIAEHHPGSAMNYFYARFMESFLKEDFADLLGEPVGRDLNPQAPTIDESLPFKTILSRRVENDRSIYEIAYPSMNEPRFVCGYALPYYLTLPLGKDYLSFSFAEPVDLARIELSGDGMEDAEIYYRCVNEDLGYDDHTVRPFGEQSGGVWTDDAPDRVTTLMIHAKCRNDDGAVLTMKLTPAP